MTTQTNKDYSEEEKTIAMYSKALGHPVRVAILNYLSSLDTCFFGDICKELPIANSTVSQHLNELKKANLIQGTIAPPKVYYCINKENWKIAKTVYQKFFS